MMNQKNRNINVKGYVYAIIEKIIHHKIARNGKNISKIERSLKIKLFKSNNNF